MDLSFREDPDSGHPTPRLEFNPSEMATSTPIPSSRQSRLRSHSSSFRPTSPGGVDYRTVDGVIQVVKENKQLREEVDELRNQSMMSDAELNESRARISQLEEQVRTITFELPTLDLRTGKQEEPSDKWTEERKQLEGQKEEIGKELRETKDELSEEKRKNIELEAKCEKMKSEKDQILERTTSLMKRNDALWEEKGEEMKEEMKRKEEMMEEEKRKMEKEIEEMREEARLKEAQLEEGRRMVKEKEEIVNGLMEEKKKMEEVKEKNGEMEKEMEALREKIGEMENELTAISTEGERILGLEKKIKELERKNTVAEEELADAIKRYEDLRAVREDEMAETLAAKTKVHELRGTIDNLNRVNGELEEKKRESVRMKDQLNEKIEEGKKMKNEMDQLKADAERRKELQKRLEDELDIARKMSKDAADEMNRMSEEREKEKEEGRMEWMSKELRDNEELKMRMDKEREESEKRMNEAVAEANRFQHLFEDGQHQFHIFRESAEHQYAADMAAKDEELHAMRERLAEFENYPGRLVSVDGRYSEGRSVYDLFPTQLKDFVDHTTNDSVRRAVECCKSMVIRGPIDNREERRDEAPPTLEYLPILIERLEGIEMHSLRSKSYLAFIIRMFKKMEGEEGTDEMISSLSSNIEEEMIHLDREWREMEKRNKMDLDNAERSIRKVVEENRRLEEGIRKTEEERTKMEEEAIRADEGRKKALNELMNTRATLVTVKAKRDEFEEAAIGFKEQFEVKVSELKDADEGLDEWKEEYQRMINEKERKIRMQDQTYIEMEKKLEDLLERNSDLSKKLVAETNEVQKEEKESRRVKKELERAKRGKEQLIGLIREFTAGLKNHYNVYKRVKGRNEQRQMLLDRCLNEIDKINRSVKSGRLEKLEETIRSEVAEFQSADVVDYRECRDIQKHIDSLLEEKENI